MKNTDRWAAYYCQEAKLQVLTFLFVSPYLCMYLSPDPDTEHS